MLQKQEILSLLNDVESSNVERTISTTNTDKFGEAICAFCNDLPNKRQPGYLFIGAYDDGKLYGLKVTDALLKNLASIRTDRNIVPQPSMTVEKYSFDEGDLAVVEVFPSELPPVRYKGRIYVRIGPRRAVANEGEERLLLEKRIAKANTFDALPCLNASINDIDTNLFRVAYLPKIFPADVLQNDHRSVEQQMQALGFFDCKYNCPTNAGMILFGEGPSAIL